MPLRVHINVVEFVETQALDSSTLQPAAAADYKRPASSALRVLR